MHFGRPELQHCHSWIGLVLRLVINLLNFLMPGQRGCRMNPEQVYFGLGPLLSKSFEPGHFGRHLYQRSLAIGVKERNFNSWPAGWMILLVLSSCQQHFELQHSVLQLGHCKILRHLSFEHQMHYHSLRY